MIRWTVFLQGRPLNHLAMAEHFTRHSQSRGAQPVFSSACHRDGDGEAVLACPYIYIIKSVLVVLFCYVLLFFHFLVFPGDTTGTLYLQVTIIHHQFTVNENGKFALKSDITILKHKCFKERADLFRGRKLFPPLLPRCLDCQISIVRLRLLNSPPTVHDPLVWFSLQVDAKTQRVGQ